MYVCVDLLSSDSSDSDESVPYATTKERYLKGLKHGRKRSKKNVLVGYVKGRGRSGFAARDFKAGDFVCEYVGTVREVDDCKNDWGDISNQELDTGCYCLDVTFNGKNYVIDATNEPNHPGRYINHARRNPNLKMMQPVTLGKPPKSQLRIGLVAKNDIKEKQELFFDYGISGDQPWLRSDAKKIGITLDQGMDFQWLILYCIFFVLFCF